MWLFLWDSEPSKIFVGDTPISKVFLWDTQIRPKWWWQPWTNTIAYYPLNWDINDYSWNNRNLSVTFGTVSYTTLSSWIQVFSPRWTSITSWWTWLSYSDSVWNFTWDFTVNFYVRLLQPYNNYMSFVTNRDASWYRWMNSINQSNNFFFHGQPQYLSWWTMDTNVWHNICCTVISGVYYIYVDSTLKKSGSYSYWTWTPWTLNIGYWFKNIFSQWEEPCNWDISAVIIENAWWASTEVSDYYNQTKSNYGL